MFQQVIDFRDESEALYRLMQPLPPEAFATRTQFKQWTFDDVVGHLHLWNRAADLSLTDEAAFQSFMGEVFQAVASGGLRAFERRWLAGLRGPELLDAADPQARVQWAGPDMSVRSSITARLMETWAHGLAVYDALGVERVDTDRIRNIAVLGVNTFGWSFKNRGLEVPPAMPGLRLTAPSGAIWEWGGDRPGERIQGEAAEFCQVITQTRNVADTGLRVTGAVARQWMSIAQCFAGPPEQPPAPGSRFVQRDR
jgi:uncharacterized protein (TIGR03084 family)